MARTAATGTPEPADWAMRDGYRMRWSSTAYVIYNAAGKRVRSCTEVNHAAKALDALRSEYRDSVRTSR